MSYQPLRLLARSQEDLQVFSACLQDAVMKQKDMAFLEASGVFVLMGNRFVWEQYLEDKTQISRVRCGLRFLEPQSHRLGFKRDAPARES